MRISDWSSDVCSSDLHEHHRRHRQYRAFGRSNPQFAVHLRSCHLPLPSESGEHQISEPRRFRPGRNRWISAVFKPRGFNSNIVGRLDLLICRRSEEHTSELQSLMRISYAVFCLKKKKTLTLI